MNRFAYIAAALAVSASTVIAAKRLQSPKGAEQYPARKRLAAPAALLPKAAVIPPTMRWITNRLAWDYPTNWDQVASINLYRGNYTNFTVTNNVGKVLTVTVTRTNDQYFAVTAVGTNGEESVFSNIIRIPPTNLIVHVYVSGGATNIYHAVSLSGPWSRLNTTNYWVTNQTGTHYYRGRGKAGNRVYIASQSQ